MTDRDAAGLRGPVVRCRTETTWWVRNAAGEMEENSSTAVTEYDSEGNIPGLEKRRRNEERSYVNGRLVTIFRVPEEVRERAVGFTAFAVEGLEGCGCPDTTAEVRTTWNQRSLPVETVFLDNKGRTLSRVRRVRDKAGRLVEQHQFLTARASRALYMAWKAVVNAGRRQRGPLRISSRFYKYDDTGRRAEVRTVSPPVMEQVERFEYNDHGDPIRHTTEHVGREAGLDEHGQLQTRDEQRRIDETRTDYLYDALGNWTERIQYVRAAPGEEYQRVMRERRALEYAADA
ncbi:MAG TPA: hypothetical protein VFA04_05290 [Bryobacteraceae bacterium]|nr:hypothetical protein [Bryobacteraceae bacterium]